MEIIEPSVELIDDIYGELTCIDGDYWQPVLMHVEDSYEDQIRNGVKPEIARSVLPMCLATELYMTANLREWRHVLKLRTDKTAHPQMRVVAGKILDILREKLPVIVEDIQS